MSLRAAVLTYADPALVKRVKDLEWLLTGLLKRPSTLMLLRSNEDDKPVLSDFVDAEPRMPEAALRAAWKDLLTDFRARIVRGDLLVTGIAISPTPVPRRVLLPADLAEKFELELVRDEIYLRANGVSSVYAAVAVSPSPQMIKTAALGSAPSTDPDVREYQRIDQLGGTHSSLQRQRGRRSLSPFIECLVRRHWPKLRERVEHDGKPVWTELARFLIKWESKHLKPAALEQLPKHNTLRNRLPEIYAKVLTEKGEDEQSGQ